MPDLISIGPVAAVPLALAFIMNILAEWALLSRQSSLELALAKSVKAIIIPALIAAYAIIIAAALSVPVN
ncbi:MAG: hypothetical protein OXE87_03255 [Chloroflexi bacterium]|nr:hypothetical protein [Chloroflexota bacterium]